MNVRANAQTQLFELITLIAQEEACVHRARENCQLNKAKLHEPIALKAVKGKRKTVAQQATTPSAASGAAPEAVRGDVQASPKRNCHRR